MKKIFSLLFLLNFILQPAFADYLDLSVDDEIRKNYNPNQIEIDKGLPPLPKINDFDKPKYVNDSKVEEPAVKNTTNTTTYSSSSAYSYTDSEGAKVAYAKMRKGKVFKLKTRCSLSDKMKKGTKVSFLSIYPVTSTFFTIPGGTVFYGEIANVHRPQLTSNGGLVEIDVNALKFNNNIIPINSRVRKVITNGNSKNIFLNKIKGERRFASNTAKSASRGVTSYNKFTKITRNYWKKGGANRIVSPFSYLTGVCILGGNTILSPVKATFSKGGNLTIPKGSIIEVKLLDDLYVYK